MNILGVGGWEFGLVILIMLIVAGPKRMVRWAYSLGKQTAKLRKMWEETAGMLQKEFEEAGLDIEVPKTPPTRGSLNKAVKGSVDKAMKPVTQPVSETLKEVEEVKKLSEVSGNGHKKPAAATAASDAVTDSAEKPAKNNSTAEFGTWSGKKPAKNDKPAKDDSTTEFGTWSGKKPAGDDEGKA
jgi:Sec-independent protein translocase protein TatA